MAAKERAQILTNRQITMLASSVSKDKLATIAENFMDFTQESIKSIQKENCDDNEAFKRKIIQIWANRNPENQVKRLAAIFHAAADRGLVDADEVETTLGLSREEALAITTNVSEEDFVEFAEKIKQNAAKTTRIEKAPWAKTYTVDMKDIYTDLALEKIENQPTGPEGETIEDYKDLFAKRIDTKRTEFTEFPAEKILMKADPGMGKTTYGKKIAYDWAKGVL